MKEVLHLSRQVMKYFAGSNTSSGFYSLFASNLNNLERLFILKGGPGTGKSYMSKVIGNEWLQKGYNIEYLHCSSDADSVDGVIIPKLKVGIVDGTHPHVIEPRFPGVIDDYVNLGVAWDPAKLRAHKREIIELTQLVSAAFKKAYKTFNEALHYYDKQRHVVSKYIHHQKVEKFTDDLIQRLFGNRKREGIAHTILRFHGANTPTGVVSFIPELTEDVGKRYFLKGSPGTGKSTLLQKLVDEAEARNFRTEVYRCEFEPEKIDMLIVRELGFAIFESTEPHAYVPEKENDVLLNLDEIVLTEQMDEEDQREVIKKREKYSDTLQTGIDALKEAKELRDQLEGYYIQAMDFTVSTNISEEINAEIKQIAEEMKG